MSTSGETGFQVVAASLSEALIATAAGLAAAIPAVLFYNVFTNQIRGLGGQVAGFRATAASLNVARPARGEAKLSDRLLMPAAIGALVGLLLLVLRKRAMS